MNPVEIVKSLIELTLDILPHEQIRDMLDDAAVKRANAAADTAERLKFGPK